MKTNKATELCKARKSLDKLATTEQQLSAHINAVDTTGSMDSLEYLESYVSTLKMILDS